MGTKTFLCLLDDVDHHGADCHCGDCNSNGASYGVSVHDVSDLAEFDSDTIVDVCRKYERIEIRIYDRDETTALGAAQAWARRVYPGCEFMF